jgi:hypothetical protein
MMHMPHRHDETPNDNPLALCLTSDRRLWPEDLFAAQVGKIIGTLFKQYGAPSPALDMGLRMLFDLVPQALSPDMLDPATATPCTTHKQTTCTHTQTSRKTGGLDAVALPTFLPSALHPSLL